MRLDQKRIDGPDAVGGGGAGKGSGRGTGTTTTGAGSGARAVSGVAAGEV